MSEKAERLAAALVESLREGQADPAAADARERARQADFTPLPIGEPLPLPELEDDGAERTPRAVKSGGRVMDILDRLLFGLVAPVRILRAAGAAAWDPEQHPRGETSPGTNAGSFAPSGGEGSLAGPPRPARAPRAAPARGAGTVPGQGRLRGMMRHPGVEGEARGDPLTYVPMGRVNPELGVPEADRPPPEAGDPDSLGHGFTDTNAETEKKYVSGEVTDVQALGGGVSRTFKAKIGGEKVVIKTNDTPGMRDNVDDNDSGRETASYVVNLALGGLVDMPVAVERDLGGMEGPAVGSRYEAGPLGKAVLIQWREGRQWGDYAHEIPPQEIAAAGLFDAIIGNEDRHGGNGNVDASFHFISIDHSLAFPSDQNVRGNVRMMRSRPEEITGAEIERLTQFESRRPAVDRALSRYLTSTEIDSMWHRVRTMRETRKLYPYEG